MSRREFETRCPDTEVLRHYLAGQGDSDRLSAVDNHLLTCLTCQQQLEQLSKESDTMTRLIQEVSRIPPVQMSGELAHSLDALAPQVLLTPETGLMQIRDYRILESIGEGGMGNVFRAIHLKLNRAVAIKVLRDDRVHSPEAIARFEREMKVIAQLEHPQIVRALDAGEHEGKQYLVMELLSGIDLGQLSQRMGPLPIAEACKIVYLAASALQYAHDRKILHRDVKPSNLLVTTEGDVKLLDLGLAQFFEFPSEPNLSGADQAVGTLAYMAPEQLSRRDEVTTKADIFSLGMTFFEILTGQRPSDRHNMTSLRTELEQVRPDIDPPLRMLIGSMVARDPEERPSSMQEVMHRLSPYIESANLVSLVSRSSRRNTLEEGETMSNSASLTAPSISSHVAVDGSTAVRWMAVAALATGTLLFGLGVSRWPSPGSPPNEPPGESKLPGIPPDSEPAPVTTGEVEITPLGDVARQLLDDGAVFFWNAKTLSNTPAVEGINTLDPGTYSIRFDAPEELETLEDIIVAKGGRRKIQLTTALKQAFQHPPIPSEVNAYSTYHGTIWHNLWKKDSDVTYTVRLQVMSHDQLESGIPTTWLKIETTTQHASGDFTETGYLKINENRWREENRLDILEGFVRASGTALAHYDDPSGYETEDLGSSAKRSSTIVVPFDAEVDQLQRVAGEAIPAERLSIQDFISLFFGDERMAAAAEPIRKLRAELAKSGDRHSWIGPVTSSKGDVSCYIVSSRSRHASPRLAGYSMARNKSEPFGFVRLEANTPMLKATCFSKSTGTGASINWESELEQVKKDLARPRSKVESNLAWHQSSIPTERAMAEWRGTIALNGQPKQMIQITAVALDTELSEDTICRWIELEVSNALDGGQESHWEAARLLVDEKRYREFGELDIKRGWLAFGNKEHVFPFPDDRDLTQIAEQRLILFEDPNFLRFGVVDVLSMLFDVDCTPRSPMSALRNAMPGYRNGESAVRSAERITLSGGQAIPGETWDSPVGSPAKYRIRKSSRIPFNMVNVSFDLGPKANIALEIREHVWLKERNYKSLLASEEALSTREEETMSRLKDKEQINWRVWTWEHQGRTFKAYAEYGGTATWLDKIHDTSNVTVILRDGRGREILVPSGLLSSDDWNWARNGRYWESFKKENNKQLQPQQYLLVQDMASTLTFQKRESDKSMKRNLDDLTESDRSWIEALRKTRKIKDLTVDSQKWLDFAPYIR
jgi:serine/threonine protein kinase